MAFSLGSIGKRIEVFINDSAKNFSNKHVKQTSEKPFFIYAYNKKPENLYNLFPRTNIVSEISLSIFQQFNLRDLEACCCVSKKWNRVASDPYLSKPAIFNEFAFGPNQWNTYYGEHAITEEEIANAFQLLPDNIVDFLKSSSEAFPKKRVMDTHVFVWVPKAMNGKEFTIDSFLSDIFSNDFIMYDALTKDRLKLINYGWVFMTKTVIPGSANKCFNEQISLLAKLNKSCLTDYTIPKFAESIVCVYTEYLRSKNKLFNDSPISYTRCQCSDGLLLRIGCFDKTGLKLGVSEFNNSSIGMAGMWRIPKQDPWVIL